MKRKTKQGSGIYSFLETTGLLENGTPEAIAAAKKLYWNNKRKAWKQEHRNETKSYTISFTAREQKLLRFAADTEQTSINKTIKSACLQSLSDKPDINKRIVGKIREALMLFSEQLNRLNNNQHIKVEDIDSLNKQYDAMMQSVLFTLSYTEKFSF